MSDFSVWVKLFLTGFATGIIPAGLFWLLYVAVRSVRDAGEAII